MGNAASSLPYGAQSSQVQTTLACDVGSNEGFVLSTSHIVLSTTAPLYGGTGQQISFSDVAGSVVLPYNSSQAIAEGASTYSVNVTFDFDVTNATPTSFTYSQVSTGSWDDTPLSIPDNAVGVLPAFGPFTLGTQGQISDFQLSRVSFSLLLYHGQGELLESHADPVLTTCRPVKVAPISVGFQAIISSTVIDNSTGVQAPSSGVPASFALSNDSLHSVKANVPIMCAARRQMSRTNNYNLSIEASAPTALINGQSFEITNANIFVTVPGDILGDPSGNLGDKTAAEFVDLGQNFFGSGISGPGLGTVLDNATPSSFDFAKDFSNASEPSTARPLFTGRYFPVYNTNPITFPLPQFGTLTFSDLTAGEVGTAFGLIVSRLQAIISVSSESGQVDGTDVIDCKPAHSYAVLRAPILAA